MAGSTSMPIPSLLATGLLPVGRHDATMVEVQAAFGSLNTTRMELYRKLEEFVELSKTFGVFRRVYIDGSFVTDKPTPGDIDSVLEMNTADLLKFSAHPNRLALLDGFAVKAKYGVHLFMQRETQLDSAGDMTLYFQQIKAADAIHRKVDPSTRRGILVVSL